jgi:small-conductance mechanosensitive channel
MGTDHDGQPDSAPREHTGTPRADAESSHHMRQLFTTHSHSWRDVGLARELSRRAVKRARIQSLVLLPLLVAVLVVYGYREKIFGPAYDTPVRIVTFLALISLGWQFARDAGRALGPTLFRRMDPGTAGTVGFLLRLVTMLAAVLVALRIAGLGPRTLALGGAFTAVVVGLAAQQTLGNLFAGMVLLSARPFRVGERVKLQGGGLAGTVDGVVSSLGLLYTTLASGDDAIMVPNSVVLNVAIVPLREPEGVDLRARLRAGLTPLDVQRMLQHAVETPMRDAPRIALEEIDGDEVVVRITAIPEHPADGPKLASEVLDAVAAHAAGARG